MFLARFLGSENTQYTSTWAEKYSFTGSEEKGEKNLILEKTGFAKNDFGKNVFFWKINIVNIILVS